MSAKGKSNVDYDETTVEAEDLPTHQEAIPVPYLAGTNLVAIRFLAAASGMITRQAPDARPEKK